MTQLLDKMTGKQKLLATLFLLIPILLIFTMLTANKINTLIVGVVICVIMWFSQPIWLPENYGATQVRMISLVIALTAITLNGLWQQVAWNFIAFVIKEFLPEYFNFLTPFQQLSSEAGLGFLLLVIIVVNYFNRDRTAMGVHPHPLEKDVPNLTYEQKLEAVADVLSENLKTIDRQTKWNSKSYTPLDAEVETIKNNRREKRIDDLLTAIKKSRDRVFLVLGEPGSGKSVALRKLCQDMLYEVAKTRKIPIYVNLKEWLPTHPWHEDNPPEVRELYDFIEDNIKSRDIYISRFFNQKLNDGTSYFDRLHETGHLYFVLDSFDEIPAMLNEPENSALIKELSAIIYTFLKGSNPNKSQGILASRIFRQPTSHFDASTRFEIRSFSEEKIQQAFKNYGFNDQETIRILFATHPNLIPVASNPFSATLIAEYYENNDGQFPANQSEMYENYILDTLKDCQSEIAKRDLQMAEIITTTTEIAHKMFEQYGLEVPLDQLRNDLPDGKIDQVVGILKFAKIGRLGLGNENLFSFVHRRFAEYFAVKKLLSQDSLVDVSSIPNDSQLRDALVLYCEVADETKAKQIANFCWSMIEDASTLQDSKVIHSLRFLTDAFRGRPHLLDDFRGQLGAFIVDQIDPKNNFLSVKLAVESTGILETPDIDKTVLKAFQLNIPPINETCLKSCRNLPKISENLEYNVIQFIDTYQGFSYLKNRKTIKFSLSLSKAFDKVSRFVDLKTWSLWLFIVVGSIYFIVYPMPALIIFGLSVISGFFISLFMKISIYLDDNKFINSLLIPLRPRIITRSKDFFSKNQQIYIRLERLFSIGQFKKNNVNLNILSDFYRLWYAILTACVILPLINLTNVEPLIEMSPLRSNVIAVTSEQNKIIFCIIVGFVILACLPLQMIYPLSIHIVNLKYLLVFIFKRLRKYTASALITVALLLLLISRMFSFLSFLENSGILNMYIPPIFGIFVLIFLGLKIIRWWKGKMQLKKIYLTLCSNRKYIYEKYTAIQDEHNRLKFINLLDIHVRNVSGDWPDDTFFESQKIAKSESLLRLAMLDEKWRGYNR